MMKFLFNDPALKERRKELRGDATETEVLLWQKLKNKQLGGYKFVRQYGVGGYILDFYCPQKKIAIEIDGSQHAEDDAQAYDQIRTQFLKDIGIDVLRFWNNEIFQNMDAVCGVIWEIRIFDLTPPPLILSGGKCTGKFDLFSFPKNAIRCG